MSEPLKAWHFVGDKLRDGRHIPKDGEWLIHTEPVEMCVSGLHASLHPLDALQYAPGSTLCLVDVQGEIEHQSDKLVCRERRIVARKDFSPELRLFARQQALSVIHIWKAPPVVVEYLNTGDEALRVAAWAAAQDAAWTAAWTAARDAARGAARQSFLDLVNTSFNL